MDHMEMAYRERKDKILIYCHNLYYETAPKSTKI